MSSTGAWGEINTVRQKVEVLMETLWAAVVPKKIRESLDELLTGMKNTPPKLRQYEAFDCIQEQLNAYIKLNTLIADLKTDVLKYRHWKQVSQVLKVAVVSTS